MSAFFCVPLSLFLFVSFPSVVRAFSIEPGVLDVAVRPGESVSATFTFTNTSDEDARYSIDLVQMQFKEGEEDPEISSIETPHLVPSSAPEDPANWFDHDEDIFILRGHEKKDITIHIHPPVSVPAQVFFLGVRLLEQPISGSGVMIRRGALEPVFITIGEGLTPHVTILSFTYPPFFQTSFPRSASITLRNDGDGMAIPSGSVLVKNVFGSMVGSFLFNPEGKRLPPGETRTWSILTPVSGWLNVYSVVLLGGEESAFAPIGEPHYVVVVSPWLVGGIIAGAIFFVVGSRWRKQRQK